MTEGLRMVIASRIVDAMERALSASLDSHARTNLEKTIRNILEEHDNGIETS